MAEQVWELIHHTTKIKDVAEQWRIQHSLGSGALFGRDQIIYDRLCGLGDDPDPARVADIIGNQTWSNLHCDGCGGFYTTLVGHDVGEYSERAYCRECLDEAQALLKEDATKHHGP